MRFKWKLVLVLSEILLISTQDRCMVCVERTIGLEIIFDAPMELLGDVGHVESRFGSFGDSVSVGARWVQDLRQTNHRLRNRFGRTCWYCSVMRLKRKLFSVQLDIVLVLMQDRCMVCAERTIGSEIVLDAHDCTPK